MPNSLEFTIMVTMEIPIEQETIPEVGVVHQKEDLKMRKEPDLLIMMVNMLILKISLTLPAM